MQIITGYIDFIKKCLYSVPDDLERPYHKVANMIMKTVGLIVLLFGLFHVYSGWVTFSLFGDFEKSVIEILFGMTHVFLAISMGPVLIIRYLAFTLPDKIYLRTSASKEERDMKKRG